MDLSYLAIVMLAVNLLVFLGGCTLAVYRTHVAPGRHTTTPHANALPTSGLHGSSATAIPE